MQATGIEDHIRRRFMAMQQIGIGNRAEEFRKSDVKIHIRRSKNNIAGLTLRHRRVGDVGLDGEILQSGRQHVGASAMRDEMPFTQARGGGDDPKRLDDVGDGKLA